MLNPSIFLLKIFAELQNPEVWGPLDCTMSVIICINSLPNLEAIFFCLVQIVFWNSNTSTLGLNLIIFFLVYRVTDIVFHICHNLGTGYILRLYLLLFYICYYDLLWRVFSPLRRLHPWHPGWTEVGRGMKGGAEDNESPRYPVTI